MKLRIVIFIQLIACILAINSCSLSSQIKKADQKYKIGEYATAGSLYRRILPQVPSKNKPLRAEIAYKMGICYRLINDNMRAEGAFSNAIRYGIEDSTAYLYYADVLSKTDKQKDARSFYQKYLNTDPKNTWAQNGLLSSEKAKEWKKLTTPYTVKKADAFNSRKGDFCPAVADDDGSTVYFTSSRDNTPTGMKRSKITGIRNNDIFMVKKKLNGKWETPTPLPVEINTEFDEGACTFSADKKAMYFTQCRTLPAQTLGAEIYCSQRAGGEWTVPKKIKLVKDSTISVAHPAMSPDNSYLYFVSDMKGGFGGKDIWRSAKISDTEWGVPENLGKDINTPGDEMFPSFKEDGTLYFSSNGLPGFGGLDIYKATLNKDKKDELSWTVKNMQMPINSNGDDFGITFIGTGNKGYFSSNRKEPKGYDKIYSFEVPVVELVIEGKVLDNNGDPVPDANVRIVGDNGTNSKVRVKKDGSYRYKLEKGVNYIMQASARGYVNDKGNMSTMDLSKTTKFSNNFKLSSIGKPVKVDNIFYEFGKYTLTASSEEALKGIVKMLNDNPHITIEIGAHTDMVGSEEANQILATKRAESVVNFLVKSGIEEERLTAKGYGKSKPVVVDEALAKQYDFIKEGDVLNEETILKLTDKQQDIANKINRRTEFLVLKTTYKMY